MKTLRIKTRHLILACLFIAPILFSNCKKDDDKICDLTLLVKENEYVRAAGLDFRNDPSISNCTKLKTSLVDFTRVLKETQQCIGSNGGTVTSESHQITTLYNDLDCSVFE